MRSDHWNLATTIPIAVRSGESCAEKVKTPSDRWGASSDRSRSSSSYWNICSDRYNIMQRPLSKRAEATDNEQRPLAKMQLDLPKMNRRFRFGSGGSGFGKYGTGTEP